MIHEPVLFLGGQHHGPGFAGKQAKVSVGNPAGFNIPHFLFRNLTEPPVYDFRKTKPIFFENTGKKISNGHGFLGNLNLPLQSQVLNHALQCDPQIVYRPDFTALQCMEKFAVAPKRGEINVRIAFFQFRFFSRPGDNPHFFPG